MKYSPKTNESVTMVDCPYFTTNIIALDGTCERDYMSLDSFVLYICAEGEASIRMGDATEHIGPLDLVMIPAEADSVELNGKAKLLEVYIK